MTTSRIILAFMIGFTLAFAFSYWAHAQDMAGHPHRDQAIHEKFYSNWMQPDMPNVSCCGERDCAPAESKLVNGHWYARKVGETGDFTEVPDEKVEHNRDTPDGRSHLCSVRAWTSATDYQESVLCFIAGAGG